MRRLGIPAALAALVATSACVEELPPITGTTSLRVELLRPEPGSPEDRLPADTREVAVSIEALDAQGETDVGFEGTIELYAHFLGSLTPTLSESPLTSVDLVEGASDEVTVELPSVYGPTFVWAEHVSGDNPTQATGTSESLWYRDPHVEDVTRPADEDAPGALESSPLAEKHVTIDRSRYGETGRLVVSSVLAEGYTLQDVSCEGADATLPCTSDAYDSVFVFTFSRPTDHRGRAIRRGHVISSVSGSVTLFNGLIQFGFPQTILADEPAAPERVAPPVTLDPSWLDTPKELNRLESALLAVENAEVCPLDEDYESFDQWKLDVGRGCGDAINVVSAGRIEGFDPADYVGEELPRVVGPLLPINIGSFHVWIIHPRDADDVTLPET